MAGAFASAFSAAFNGNTRTIALVIYLGPNKGQHWRRGDVMRVFVPPAAWAASPTNARPRQGYIVISGAPAQAFKRIQHLLTDHDVVRVDGRNEIQGHRRYRLDPTDLPAAAVAALRDPPHILQVTWTQFRNNFRAFDRRQATTINPETEGEAFVPRDEPDEYPIELTPP